jgi:hypothetical protein
MKKFTLTAALTLALIPSAALASEPVEGSDPGNPAEETVPSLNPSVKVDLGLGEDPGIDAVGVSESLPGYGGATGSVRITSVDNSGTHRQLTMWQSLCKDTTVLGRLIEFKMNFGSGTRTDWKGGISRLSSGCSSGSRSDTYYFPNSARGVWARLCIDDPGPVNRCGDSNYISI